MPTHSSSLYAAGYAAVYVKYDPGIHYRLSQEEGHRLAKKLQEASPEQWISFYTLVGSEIMTRAESIDSLNFMSREALELHDHECNLAEQMEKLKEITG